jgi:hypothetical protein
VREPADHFLAHQAVGATAVGLAGLLGVGLRLPLAPLQAQTTGHGDRVHENGLVLVQDRRIAKARAHRIEVRLAVGLVIAQCRVWATNEDREVTALLPCAWADGVARPTFDSEIASFQVEEQGGGGLQRPELGGLADAALANEHALDATALSQALVGSNDGQAHLRNSLTAQIGECSGQPS